MLLKNHKNESKLPKSLMVYNSSIIIIGP